MIIKLNGGLGTSMGMDKAKSLLPVRDGKTFLDLIVAQVRRRAATYGAELPLIFMNSFRTQDDTLAALAPYPEIAVDGLGLDFLQNSEPKLRADDLTPVEWPADPTLEWCPPGHGDLYTALDGSGILDRLLELGYRYAIGVQLRQPRCGARRDDRRLVRGQRGAVRGGDLPAHRRRPEGRPPRHPQGRPAADPPRHRPDGRGRDALLHRRVPAPLLPHQQPVVRPRGPARARCKERNSVLGLPLIKNEKTVDPADSSSPKVIQIESAMGAAIEVFEGATAIGVGRERFLPVKTTSDLLLLRSDVYEVGSDGRLTKVVETRRR